MSFPKTHHLFAIARGTPNTTYSKEGKSPPMVRMIRLSIFGSPMMAPNSLIVGHSSTPLKRKNMASRDPIVGNSTKNRFIHPYLMVWKDTRKTIGGDGILEIRTEPSNPSRDIK